MLAASPPPPTAAGPSPAAPAPARRPRVLVVDDSPMIHRLIKAWLAADCEVACVADGRGGLKEAVDGEFSLIVLDVEMPGIDGYEICRLLKKDPRTAETPVVFLSAASQTAERIRGLEMGAVDYVVKPFDPAEFQARVRAALRTKRLIDLLAERSRVDALTELHNRAYLDERLPTMESYSRRSGGVFSCLVVDIDDMARVNERCGHAFGDRLIKRVGETLRETVRGEDVLCRWGGEEFAILTPQIGARGAATLGRRICEAVAALTVTGAAGRTARVTCSVGVAANDNADESSAVLQADAAMRAARRGGGNQVSVAEPPASRAAA